MIALAGVALALLQQILRFYEVSAGWGSVAIFALIFGAVHLDKLIFRTRAAQRTATKGRTRGGSQVSSIADHRTTHRRRPLV
jgi:hypothetical protein